jgi:tetratricopeptide (TPR) repeat protein
MILSVLVGPWTWLYTYSNDNWKFWLSILVGYGFVLINALTGISYFMAVWIAGCLTIWVVSIVTAARRNQNWYESLNAIPAPLHTQAHEFNKKRVVAIVSSYALIAVLIATGFLTNQPPKEGTLRWYSEKAEQSLSAGRGAERSGQSIEAEKYFQEAIDYLSKAIQMSPNDVYLYGTRGYTYFKMKDYQSALQDQSEAIRLSPNSGGLYYNRSLTYENLGMNALAIADLEKCIELTKDNSLKEIYRGRISTLSK